MDLFIKFTLFLSSFVLANSFSLEHNPPHSFKIETSSFSAQFYGSLDEPILKKSFLISPLQRLIPGIKIQRSEIPRSPEHARVARYLVHNLDWCAIATISTRDPLKNLPFANVFSFSDGIESTGIPYMYLPKLEMSVKDILVNPQVSMTLSLAQTSECFKTGLDIQDPRCSHIILNGEIKILESGSKEESFARTALFSKHPEMPTWEEQTKNLSHNWFFAKLEISNILVLDFFGGGHNVSIEEYFAAKP